MTVKNILGKDGMLSHALMCCSFVIDCQVPWENQLLIAVVFLQCQQFLSPSVVKTLPSLQSRCDIIPLFFFFFLKCANMVFLLWKKLCNLQRNSLFQLCFLCYCYHLLCMMGLHLRMKFLFID